MQDIQNTDYKGTETLKIMSHARNYNNTVVELALSNLGVKSGKILDFGAGIGTYSTILKSKGFDVTCVEIDTKQVKILKEKGFSTLNDINLIENNSVENMVSFNVFEHIKNDAETLKIIYNKLTNNGKLFIFVPASQDLYSKFDERLGHYRRYEMQDLQNLLKNCGYEISSTQYFDSLGYLLAKLYKLLKINGSINSAQILIFDKILFPISMILDKIFNTKFGKNIVITAQKSSD